MMTEREAYVAFNLTEKVGLVTVDGLRQQHGSVAAAWEAYPKKVSRTGGEVDWRRELALAEKHGVTIVTPADDGYPPILRESSGGPLALYVRGDVAALSKSAIAIIGTRRMTPYGESQAGRFGFDLAQAGWSVVSGLALGIDAAAHRGALDAKGVTVGVIGSGLDRFYPEENIPLARDIVRSGGAVVSQFPFGRPPDRETFPIRNHVVAALCRGVLAIEAPVKSGTLITTSAAADLGRTVMALPARVDSKMSAGCLQLIRDGAILVRHADDVLEAMGDLFPRTSAKKAPAAVPGADPEQPPYTVEEAMVMLHVDEDGISLDELSRETKLPAEKIGALAMSLRLKGFVKFLPGNRISLLTVR